MALKKVLLASDFQLPFHDKRATNLWFKVLKGFKPDQVVYAGDIDDACPFGRWTAGGTQDFMNNLPDSPSGDDMLRKTFEYANDTRKFYADTRDAIGPDAEMFSALGNHDCFSMENHRVITKDGYKRHDELNIGDFVLSMDDDGSRCWQEVQAIHLYPDDNSNLIKFDYRNVRGEFTANHRFLTYSKPGSVSLREHTAAEFIQQWGGTFVTAAKNNLPDYNGVTDDEIRLLAWCLTDSSVSKYHWTFHQSEPKHDRIIGILNRLGIGHRDYSRQRDTTEICGKVLKTAPKISHDINVKRSDIRWGGASRSELPGEVWEFSARQVGILIEEIQFTDGTLPTNGTSIPIYCSDEGKRDQLRILMTMNGIASTETEYAPGYWRINSTNRSVSKVELSKKPTTTVKANGVWCITVPNGRFFVEAFGATHLTGNCRPLEYFDKKNMSEVQQQVNPESLWGLKSIGCDYIYYSDRPAHLWGGYYVHHGMSISKHAGESVRNDVDNFGVSLIRGHSHRQAIYNKTYQLRNETLTGIELGHFMDINCSGASYDNVHNWQQGFGVAWVEDNPNAGTIDGKYAHIDLVRISPDYTCVVGGKLYKA